MDWGSLCHHHHSRDQLYDIQYLFIRISGYPGWTSFMLHGALSLEENKNLITSVLFVPEFFGVLFLASTQSRWSTNVFVIEFLYERKIVIVMGHLIYYRDKIRHGFIFAGTQLRGLPPNVVLGIVVNDLEKDSSG